KKSDHCRQLFCRAKKKLSDTSFTPSLAETSQLFESFKKACTLDNFNEFIQHLKHDVADTFSKKK
ncbi:MAG: RNA polymerase subunit sigma, partial [Flammeovirgaceae bacterium]